MQRHDVGDAAAESDLVAAFRLFGYPGLAILLFLGAAVGAVGLVFTILVNDIRARRVRGRGRN